MCRVTYFYEKKSILADKGWYSWQVIFKFTALGSELKKLISDTAYLSWWQSKAWHFNFSKIQSMISYTAHSDIKIFMIVSHTNKERRSELGRDCGSINSQRWAQHRHFNQNPVCSLHLGQLYARDIISPLIWKYMLHNPYEQDNALAQLAIQHTWEWH